MHATDDGRQIAIKKNYAQYFAGYDFSAAFVKGKPYAIKVTDSDGDIAGVIMPINEVYNLNNAEETVAANNKFPEDNEVKEENTNVREETISDTGDAESKRGMGEEVTGRKGSNREQVSRKIKEILRKSYVERSDNGVNGRGRGTETGTETGRVEQTETSEEFEERVWNDGYQYATLGKLSIGYKYAPKSKWSKEAKIAAENIRSLGLTVVVFEGELHANYNGVSEILTAGVTAGSGDYLTIFISSDLDIDGMETAYHEAFHALRKSKNDKLITQRNKMVDIISDGADVESEAFENFVSVIRELYSYEVRNVNIDYFSEEVTEEFYAWYIGTINAMNNAHGADMLEYIKQFSDVDNIKSQIEALFAEIKSDSSNLSENESVNDVHNGVLDGENKEKAHQSSSEPEAERYDIPEGSEIVKNIVVDEHSKRLKRENPRAYSNIVRMAKRLGMNVRFVKGLTDENGKALEGLITSKGIFINADAKNPSRFVATHEFGHRMKQAAPEVWAAYQEYVINKLKRESFGNGQTAYDVLYEETKNAYGKDDTAYINEEIAVNYAGELFDSEEMLESFIREDKSLALRVRDWWYNVLESMGLLSEKKKAQQLWLKAYTAAAKNVKEGKVGEFNGEKLKYVGKTDDGRKIYRTNYKEGTPKSVKQNDLIEIIQNIWSKKPIQLIIKENGAYKEISANFNPELSERSDLSKIVFGNRKGTGSEKRMTLDLSTDLYQIASDAKQTGSKAETGKDNKAHDGVKHWYYFITNLVYEDVNGKRIDCYMNIDVKENQHGHYFYSFAIEKGTAPQTLLAVVSDEMSPTVPTDNSISNDIPTVNTNSMQNTAENAQEGKKSIAGTRLSELVDKYGAIPTGEKPHRNVQVPQKTSHDKKVSQTVRTILEAKATPDEAVPTIEKMVEDGTFSYDVYTGKQAIADASA